MVPYMLYYIYSKEIEERKEIKGENFMKTLYFDMDGTIADLYGVENWLQDLRNYKVDPYINAKPMYDTSELNKLLIQFKEQGYNIEIITWGAKESTEQYLREVHQAKSEWLNRYSFPYDRMHTIPYGTSKSSRARDQGILIDDNKLVREEWSKGETIDATKNILQELKNYLETNL